MSVDTMLTGLSSCGNSDDDEDAPFPCTDPITRTDIPSGAGIHVLLLG